MIKFLIQRCDWHMNTCTLTIKTYKMCPTQHLLFGENAAPFIFLFNFFYHSFFFFVQTSKRLRGRHAINSIPAWLLLLFVYNILRECRDSQDLCSAFHLEKSIKDLVLIFFFHANFNIIKCIIKVKETNKIIIKKKKTKKVLQF